MNQNEGQLKIFVGALFVSLATFMAFYNQYYLGPDVATHTGWAICATRDVLAFMKNIRSYPMWHYFTKLFYCLEFNEAISSAISTSIANAIAFISSCIFVQEVFPKKQFDNGVIFIFLICFVGPLYLPMFNQYYYVGQWSPNVWHNPTNVMVKPFAIIATMILIKLLCEDNQNNVKLKHIGLSIILALSAFAKPSYLQGIIPGVALYMVISYAIKPRHDKMISYLKVILDFIPATIVFVIQTLLTTSNNANAYSIGIGWGRALHIWTTNIGISIILAFAFPIYVLIINFSKLIKDKRYVLLVCYEVATILESILFYIKDFEACCDFSWAGMLSMYIMWLFSLFYFLQENASTTFVCKTKYIYSRKRILSITGFCLLGMHLFFGIIYWMQFAGLLDNFMNIP